MLDFNPLSSFQRDRKPLRSGQERSEFDIREHRSANLTPNARVCLHANLSSLSYPFPAWNPGYLVMPPSTYNVKPVT